ncbi:hypothetical protein JCM10450v2_007403 [Rhodotorula kratochvilovae]
MPASLTRRTRSAASSSRKATATPTSSSSADDTSSSSPPPAGASTSATTPTSSSSPKASVTPLSTSALKKQALYSAARAAGTPFPQWVRPTPAEAQTVCDLLASVHGMPSRPTILVDKEDAPAGCGQVPSVLDALVRTTLSQNTTSKNSTAAKVSMDAVYGRANYRAVLEGGDAKLEEAIRCGGLAKNKSKAIVGMLRRIEERNVVEKGLKPGEGELSLDWLHQLSDEDAMKELISYDLVGVKTASCVLLFCLGRDSFAVDTHVHRITQSLGWLPSNGSIYSTAKDGSFTRQTSTTQPPTRDQTFYHLDHRLPAHLKYPLHSLLVRHGRGCVRCAANGVTTQDFVDTCPIEALVRRTKGKGVRKPVKSAKGETVGVAKDEGDGAVFEPLEDAAEDRVKEELGSKKGEAVKPEDEDGQPAADEGEDKPTPRAARAKRGRAAAPKTEGGAESDAPPKRARQTARGDAALEEEKPLAAARLAGRGGFTSSKTSTLSAKGKKSAVAHSVNRDEAEMSGRPYTMHGMEV